MNFRQLMFQLFRGLGITCSLAMTQTGVPVE